MRQRQRGRESTSMDETSKHLKAAGGMRYGAVE
jgi:hypothetical protein